MEDRQREMNGAPEERRVGEEGRRVLDGRKEWNGRQEKVEIEA